MIEDLLFNTEIFLKCNFFYATNKTLYYYCKHKGSISTSYHEKKLSSFAAYDRLLGLLGNEEQYSFAIQVVNNAKCDFARWLLCFYYENDRESYSKVRSRYHAVIKENYRYIIGRNAKVAAILVLISPRFIKYAKRMKA